MSDESANVELGIIILAFNEVESLAKTVNDILELALDLSYKILISTSIFASTDCRAMANKLAVENRKVRVFYQKRPYVAAAVLEATTQLNCKLIIYMSADGETPAKLIPSLVLKQKVADYDIVSASRWISGGSFTGYGPVKYCTSWAAQKLCKLIYRSPLTEFTYGYRIYKKEVLVNNKFKEIKHPFFLESLLLPIRKGVRIAEVPVNWIPRTEGVSVVGLSTLISYIKPLIRIRLTRKSRIQ
jgi:hypothetical protein